VRSLFRFRFSSDRTHQLLLLPLVISRLGSGDKPRVILRRGQRFTVMMFSPPQSPNLDQILAMNR
jgi:hypothetical protein